MQTDQNLFEAVCVHASAEREFKRRVQAGKLYVEPFGCALRVAGPGVDLIVARRNTVTAEDLEPVGRGR